MILLTDVRDFIATLNIAVDNNCCSGKLDNSKEKAIGIYNLKSNRSARKPIGGNECKSYETKSVSLLVHWNKYATQTEKTAIELYDALEDAKQITVNEHTIKFIELLQSEPVSVGTDDNGIYEYVIECLIYYER